MKLALEHFGCRIDDGEADGLFFSDLDEAIPDIDIAQVATGRLYFWRLLGACRRRTPRARSNRRVASERARSRRRRAPRCL